MNKSKLREQVVAVIESRKSSFDCADEIIPLVSNNALDEAKDADEINQLVETVEKILDKDFMFAIDKLNMYLQEGHKVDIKQAFRDFITSNHGKT